MARFERWLSNPEANQRIRRLAVEVLAFPAATAPDNRSIVSRSKDSDKPAMGGIRHQGRRCAFTVG
jgi:hypothetical protein